MVSVSPFTFRFLATARVQNEFGQMDSSAHPRGEMVGEKKGFDEEAVEHYLEGQQFADVIRLIEKKTPLP
ncbi:hypothetical protein ACFSQ7_46825 [Paenibacillus rhizoplanae]